MIDRVAWGERVGYFYRSMLFRTQSRPLPRLNVQPAPRASTLGQFLLFTVIPGIIIVALMYLAVFGPSGFIRRHRMLADLERVEDRLEERNRDNTHIQREIQHIRSDEQILRGAITEELLLAAPNSTVYRFEPLPEPE